MLQTKRISEALLAAEHPVLLESTTQMQLAVKEWKSSAVLGIDTEFVRERTYRADLGLIQVSDGRTAWLVDPVSLDSLDSLSGLMNQLETTKILHSSSEDLEVLLHTLGALPEPMVDTQIACAMLGQPLQMAYRHAVKWLFDVEIDKDQTRSNWCRRPLNSNQLRYAAMDVVLLPIMLRELQPRLEDAGRWEWLQEDVARLKRNSRTTVQPEDAYLRFPGIGRLDESSLSVLQALAAWREKTARSRNRARGFVISDAGLMQLTRLKPSSTKEIRDVDEIHPGALNRYQDQLLQLIGEAQLQKFDLAMVEQLGNAQKRQVNSMRKLVRARAEELGVDPALLASKRELEKLIRAVTSNQAVPERFLGWRKQAITEDLLEQFA